MIHPDEIGVIEDPFSDGITTGYMDYDKDNEIITADIYLYTYPITTEAETSAQVNARTAMNNKEFDRAKKLIVEDSDGKYERKTIRFKINNNGKFFKYQIISIKTTDK